MASRVSSCRYCKIDVFPPMVSILAEGDHGSARVAHVSVTDQAARLHNLRVDINRHRMESVDYLLPGDYAQLFVNGDLVMSDTPMERTTNIPLMARAHGRVLIAGLGMGMVVHGLVGLPRDSAHRVTDITVVERSEDVIGLVGPALPYDQDLPISVVHDDIFHYKPVRGERFNTVFFDIWSYLSSDMADEISTLKRRFRGYLAPDDPARWMGAWREDTVRRLARSHY